jgi:hypothetical protein
MKSAARFLAATSLALVSSCSYPLKIVLYNNTTTDIVVLNEGKAPSVTVAPGAAKELERLPVAFALDFGQEAMEYSLVEVWPGSFLVDGRIKLQAENDAKLYIVPHDATFPVKTLPRQPEGFPLSPVKQADLT